MFLYILNYVRIYIFVQESSPDEVTRIDFRHSSCLWRKMFRTKVERFRKVYIQRYY